MGSIQEIPEIDALGARRQLVRIPFELDVPLTPRVRRIIDTAEFRRLAQISQLGLVSLVYPAANHTRFEHSLGVYYMSLLYLKQLAHDDLFADAVSPADAEMLIAASLLHDLGHWPFCHPLEDIHLAGMSNHESFARNFILGGEIAEILQNDWSIDPNNVVQLLSKKAETQSQRILQSILSGPIDVDKMDYLARDSLHAGVPYGRNFDRQRLIGSLCLNKASDGLAITEKGRTAAEMMVFARYVMFSEVYWHHAVRSATAMLQRAFFLLHEQFDQNSLFQLTEQPFTQALMNAAGDDPTGQLLSGLFGTRRMLYKRLAQFSFFQEPELYQKLSQRTYPWLVRCGESLAKLLSKQLSQTVAPHEVIFDAPPVEREVEFNVDVYYPKEKRFRRLGNVSPVVQTLALEQFDNFVKQVRVFVHPRLIDETKKLSDLTSLLNAAIDAAHSSC